ncbi:hypothetical protein NKJ87_29890 [Mesorhizobium sp. M0027]|uniref:alpha/beta fold hydrolase n=1 Tax=unclassified Mesorhizobium TaxID=325217 RepID=UPI000420B8EA|nr:hypothetical protein [Mesorhizobium sp. LSHC420B00]
MQTAGDRWVKPEEGRYLATHIEGARYIELAGRDHVIWGENSDRLVDEIQAFVTGSLPATSSERVLVTCCTWKSSGCRRLPSTLATGRGAI